jgi:hypothetical protein
MEDKTITCRVLMGKAERYCPIGIPRGRWIALE